MVRNGLWVSRWPLLAVFFLTVPVASQEPSAMTPVELPGVEAPDFWAGGPGPQEVEPGFSLKRPFWSMMAGFGVGIVWTIWEESTLEPNEASVGPVLVGIAGAAGLVAGLVWEAVR